VYCIVLFCECDRTLDRNACDLKMSNKRRHRKYVGTFKFSSLGTNAFRMGSSNLPFFTKFGACTSTRIPGRDLLSLELYIRKHSAGFHSNYVNECASPPLAARSPH
jgi:hypothetical protein